MAAEALYIPVVILLVGPTAVLAPNQTNRREPISGAGATVSQLSG
jgi:hypothetical protein